MTGVQVFQLLRKNLHWVLSFGASGGQAGLSIITGLVLARFLGPEGRGIVFGIMFWPTFLAAAFNLSVFEAVAVMIAQARDPSEEARAERGLLALQLLVVIGATVATAAIVWVIYQFQHGGAGWYRTAAVLYACVFTPLTILDLHFRAVRQGRHDFVGLNVIRLVQPVSYVVLVVALALSGAMSERLVLVSIVVALAAALIANLASARFRGPVWEGDVARAALRTSAGFHVANIAVYAATEIDKIIVLIFLSAEMAGFYAVAVAVGGAGAALVMQSMSLVFFPSMARLVGDAHQQVELLIAYTRRTLLILILFCGALAAVCPVLIPLAFGAEFRPSVVPTVILLAAAAMKGARQVMDRGLRGVGNVNFGIVAEVTSLLAFLCGAAFLTAPMGLAGIALASAVAQFASLALLLFLSARRYEVPVWAFFSPRRIVRTSAQPNPEGVE